MFATASFVFVAYGGLIKTVALAEEIKNPGRNLPLGMFLPLIVVTILYVLVVFVTLGVLNPEHLRSTFTPISDGAQIFGGNLLKIVVSIGALLAFVTTANAAIMTASRYPLGMSKDKLLPLLFQRISHRFGTPYVSILFTGSFMVFSIFFFKIGGIGQDGFKSLNLT